MDENISFRLVRELADVYPGSAHVHDVGLRGVEDRPIGPHNLLLAATRVTCGLTMVTANLRESARVPGLFVESWAGDQ